jgi:hypothetical protein
VDTGSTIVTLVAPVVTALVGVIAVLFQEWQRRRTLAGQRRLAFEDARLQVSFVTEWWNAEKLISTSPERLESVNRQAVRWLAEASERVKVLTKESGQLVIDQALEVSAGSSIAPRRLLLLYPLHGRAAKIARVVFLLSLALLVLWGTSPLYDSPDFIESDIIISTFLAFITLAYRFWAASADRAAVLSAEAASVMASHPVSTGWRKPRHPA